MELNDAIALLTTYNRWRRGEDESLDMPNPRDIGIALDTVLAAVIEGGTGNSGVERPEPSPHFLQKGTPETDALLRQQDRDSTPYDLSADQLVKLCRKLERERIEARQQEQIHHDNTLAMQKERDNALTELQMWRDGCIVREEDKVERERDEALELLAAHAIKLQHELMRALKAERERDEARKQLLIAVGLLSTHPQFADKHPEDLLAFIKEASK
jgi:hypothetical protein